MWLSICRGHNLFDLAQHIGTILCHNTTIKFTIDIPMKGLDKAPTFLAVTAFREQPNVHSLASVQKLKIWLIIKK